MKILITVLCIIVLVQSNWIQSLDENLLDSELNSGKHLWLVYRSQNKVNQDTVRQVGNILKGFFRIAIVTSESQSLKFYGDDRENSVNYEGEYNVHKIVDFVLSETDKVITVRQKQAKNLKDYQQYLKKETQRANKEWKQQEQLRKKSNTVLLNLENWQTFTKSREPYLINFYEANNSACIELNKEWELISTELKGSVKVAKINITQSNNHKLEEQIRLSKYPSVRFYKEGPKNVNQYAQFEGVHKKFSILEWVTAQLSQKVQKAEIAKLTKANYETLCKGTKNTCIIVFLDSESSEIETQLEALALSHIKKPITFLISRKGEQQKFAEQAGVSSYPDTVMVYCKLKKIWRMGELNIQNIEDAINQISLGNRNNFVRLSFTEELQ